MFEKMANNMYSLTIKNQLSEIEKIVDAIALLSKEWSLPIKINNHLNLICEEVFSNIVFYAFSDNKEHTIHMEFQKEKHTLVIQITDNGKQFDVLNYEGKPNINASAEERAIGGLGIHILKTLVDSAEYSRKGNLNIVKLKKEI